MTHSFGATSTTDEVLRGINLSGKRVLVTGVSAGLGVETARALAAHGAEVIGAARDLSKAKAATDRKKCAHGHKITPKNTHFGDLFRTGLITCDLCNQKAQARYAKKGKR